MSDLDMMSINGKDFPPAHHIVFTGETYKNLSAECVYVWLRGDECLYVGHSSDGFRRLRNAHHIINKKEKVLPEDEFKIFLGDGRMLEAALIKHLKPKYNKPKNRRATALERMYKSEMYSYLPERLRKPLDRLSPEEYQERLTIRRMYRQGKLPEQIEERINAEISRRSAQG